MEQTAKISFDKKFWDEMYKQLRLRGQGVRESGAFLLGPEENNSITQALYYDDLEPESLDTGAIHITYKSFIALADYCLLNKLTVKADTHTHPGIVTQQSDIDMENPMIKIAGHMALIIPSFALPKKCNLNMLGIHEFIGGGYNWRSYHFKQGIIKII